MRRIGVVTPLALVLALSAGAMAHAQQRTGMSIPDFAALDANKDGKVTKDELTAALPEQAKQFADRIFDSRDANKDGAIDKAENDAAPAMGRGRG